MTHFAVGGRVSRRGRLVGIYWKSFGFQKPQQFGAGHEQFTAQSPADFELAALNETVNAEIIDTEHVGGFPDGVGQPFRGRGDRRRFKGGNGLHINSS